LWYGQAFLPFIIRDTRYSGVDRCLYHSWTGSTRLQSRSEPDIVKKPYLGLGRKGIQVDGVNMLITDYQPNRETTYLFIEGVLEKRNIPHVIDFDLKG
jgi:hypothetical protein